MAGKLPKVLILAGGGGHTGYAWIIAEELQGKAELTFLAPDDEPIGVKRLSPFGKVRTLTKPRHPTTPTWRFLLRLAKASWQSLFLVPGDADVAVSTGSNFCVPPALAAWVKGVPIVSLESRVKLERASGAARFIGRFAKLNALQWDEQRRFYEKGVVFGPLLPRRLVEPHDGGYVLVTGGTYGYRELFEAAVASDLKNVVLQTGNLDPTPYAGRRANWKVISFTDKFHELIAGASVVVTPPGGTPVEATTYGKPVVIVPYPGWTKAADEGETILFAEKIGAVVLEKVEPSALVEAVKEARNRAVKPLVNGTTVLCDAILTVARVDKT